MALVLLITPVLFFGGLRQTEQVERNYIKEKKAAVKEFEDKKIELKENLIAELEEKKKMIESEKLTMELTGGTESRLDIWGVFLPCVTYRAAAAETIWLKIKGMSLSN